MTTQGSPSSVKPGSTGSGGSSSQRPYCTAEFVMLDAIIEGAVIKRRG
ncbi:hypothetical protein ABCR94_25465 [Streptomyces sp. 21So2-11]